MTRWVNPDDANENIWKFMIPEISQPMKFTYCFLATMLVLVVMGCQRGPTETAEKSRGDAGKKQPADSVGNLTETIVIEAGPDAQTKAQEALILAEPGDLIEFAVGTFNFDGTLSLEGVKDVTLRGQGMEETILNFSNFKTGKGGEGLKVKADNFVIEDLTIEDTPGDAIKLQDCDGLTIRRVRTRWTGGPSKENGAYGLYPVLSRNVLIEYCVAECASDAGIYVGQSRQVIVRNCHAESNVAGIEIENCIGTDVYDNLAVNNTGGILVFSLPGLTIKNGSDCRVFNNEVTANNHANFAPEGAMVATVPPGTGLMIMANDRVEAFDNRFVDNHGAGCLIVSFLATQRKFDDAAYDPYPEMIHLHDNRFEGGGTDPQGDFLKTYAEQSGGALPDIVFDGILNTEKLVDGTLPDGVRFSIGDNGDASFVNLDLAATFAGKEPKISTDLTPYSAVLPRVQAVTLPGAD